MSIVLPVLRRNGQAQPTDFPGESGVGDAHPTGSKVADAIKLAGVDQSRSFLRQGEQLIHNFGRSVWLIGELLFGQSEGDIVKSGV